jgi:3-methyladenine DNA glycosylase AlkD
MKQAKGSFKLVRPQCPTCQSDEVRLVHTMSNWSRVAASTVVGFFLWPAFKYNWRCQKCNTVFSAERAMDR